MRARPASCLAIVTLAMMPAAHAQPLQSMLDPQAPAAQLIATLSVWMIGVFGVVFLLVMLIGGAGLWRGRRGARSLSGRASRNLVIAGGVVVPLLVVIALVVGSVLVGQSASRGAERADMSVEIIGRQWWWEVRYLNDAGDPVAVTANEIHLPVGANVKLLLRSADVIHTFWAPNLDGKTDMIPGLTNVAWLRLDTPGRYRGQCAEFCGTQHTLMAFHVVVQTPEEFRSWLDAQARPAAAAAMQEAEGQRLFDAKGCAECHTIRGTAAQGERGPDLTHFATRTTLGAATAPNNRGHLAGWILDPHAIKPGALMPPTALLPDELDALLAYLEALE